MRGEFGAKVIVTALPLSRASAEALRHLERYDAIVFTSKNAEAFFKQELKRRRFAPPRTRIVRVGPRSELLKFDFKGERMLFPRSALAPSDIVAALRAKGAIVRMIPLYTAKGAPLSRAEKSRLLDGTVAQLYFKSPSGIHGLLNQFRGRARVKVRSIPARCIGETTARAARKAGFRKVFIR